jgi:hypothetical protein
MRSRIWCAGRHPEWFSERLLEPMSSSVTPFREGYAVPRHREVVSPELALVDPELGRAARALLAGSLEAPHALPSSPAAIGTPLFGRRTRGEAVRDPVREHRSRRLLISVAAATMLALLLFDVRVEIGERPAAADPSAFAPGAGSAVPAPTGPVTVPRSGRGSSKKPFRATDRRFAWAPVSGASGYHVEFFRGSTRVFADETTGPLLTVPAEWSLDGSRRSLRPGTYRWNVWPIVGDRRQSHAVVQATLSIP